MTMQGAPVAVAVAGAAVVAMVPTGSMTHHLAARHAKPAGTTEQQTQQT